MDTRSLEDMFNSSLPPGVQQQPGSPTPPAAPTPPPGGAEPTPFAGGSPFGEAPEGGVESSQAEGWVEQILADPELKRRVLSDWQLEESDPDLRNKLLQMAKVGLLADYFPMDAKTQNVENPDAEGGIMP